MEMRDILNTIDNITSQEPTNEAVHSDPHGEDPRSVFAEQNWELIFNTFMNDHTDIMNELLIAAVDNKMVDESIRKEVDEKLEAIYQAHLASKAEGDYRLE